MDVEGGGRVPAQQSASARARHSFVIAIDTDNGRRDVYRVAVYRESRKYGGAGKRGENLSYVF